MQTRTAYLILLATTLFWGGNAVAGKLAVGHVSPMLINAARWGIALVILGAIGAGRLRDDWPRLRPHMPLLLLLGALGFTGFNASLYSALQYTSAINASLEQAAIPMAIFIGNFLLFGQRARPLQIAGFLVSFAGVLLTATAGEPARILQMDLNIGDALMLVAVATYAAYTVALRWRPAVHWMSLMIVLVASAFLFALPFVALEAAHGATIWPDTTGWWVIAYTAILPSILSQAFYIRGVELIGANRAGLFINLVPIFGMLLSVVLLREQLHLYHGVAILLVTCGIALAEWSGRRAAR